MLTLHPEVTFLFRNIVGAKKNALIYCNNLDVVGESTLLHAFDMIGCKITAVSPQETQLTRRIKQQQEDHKYDWSHKQRWEIVVDERLELFHPVEKFHYAFTFPPFNDDGSPIYTEDTLRDWKCSKLISKDYVAPRHIIALESLYDSVIPAGYFGAVLPRNWMGAYMKFMKWWNTSAAMVAKIALPGEAVSRYVSSNEELLNTSHYEDIGEHAKYLHAGRPLTNQKWYLVIWHKPAGIDSKRHYLSYGNYRYSSYVYDLKGLAEKDINKCVTRFRKHDWYKLSVKKYVKICVDGKSGRYRFSESDRPEFLPLPSETRVVKVSDTNKPEIKVVDTVEEIRADPRAAHIKLGPPCKVYGYSPQVQATLHDIRITDLIPKNNKEHYQSSGNGGGGNGGNGNGTEDTEAYKIKDNFLVKIRSTAFSENREWILKKLLENGLVPYMTANEYRRMAVQERWLNIQLTPIERTIKVHTETDESDRDSSQENIENTEPDNVEVNSVKVGGEIQTVDAKENEEQEKDYWETLYDDVSLKVIYPEVWNLWKSRATKMKLDRTLIEGKPVTYDFQFEDIITMACKQSLINSNVMGLGKTREALFAALLRCSKRTLFIVPTKLVGVWQEEIETTIANYVRKQRKDWAGNLMSADYQVIEWARDCEPANLKTFNIISYEKLARVPKDARFFQCPVCKFIACTLKESVRHIPCPECNKGKTKKAKALNRHANLRKKKVWVDIGNGCGRIDIVDTRVNKVDNVNQLVWMQQSETHWDKVKKTTRYRIDRFGKQEAYTIEELRKPHLKWTFSELLRYKFNMVLCDEGGYVSNPTANRSIAMNKITGRSRTVMTGTPVKGYPRSIVNLLNWCLKRSVFPEYRSDGIKQTGLRKFELKYGTYVERPPQQPKLLPKINNPELFQQEIAPLNLRHTRYEPIVKKDVPPKYPIVTALKVPMDEAHKNYYNLWLEKFAEWWQLKRIEEDNQAAKLNNDLIVKLGYLINASTIPHFMLENLTSGEGAMWAQIIGEYKGPLTQKFEVAKRLLKGYYEEGDKSIVFCSRHANIKLGYKWSQQVEKIPSIWIDGSVSTTIKEGINRSERQLRVDKFRYHDTGILWAGILCLREGYNIPEANHGVFMDYTWTPDDWQQALGRMLRPKQKKQVDATFLCHKGTAEEYMAALNILKGRSISEAIDYEAFDDFTADMIPDFKQYANAIVDGTEKELKTKMWLQIEELRKEAEEE